MEEKIEKELKWAVLGTGIIANEMTQALEKMGKNLYIMSNKKYYNQLLKSKAEAEAGNVEIHDIIEVE